MINRFKSPCAPFCYAMCVISFTVNSATAPSDDGDLLRRWCVADKGLAITSCLDMSADLLAGRVRSLMPDFKAKQKELWLICPSRQMLTPAARLLRDMLKKKTAGILRQLTARGILEDRGLV